MRSKNIGICAPSTPFSRDDAFRLMELASTDFQDVRLEFADQCFANAGHFAGDDEMRCATFVAMANDPKLDAIWFVRGGYGAARIAEDALPQLGEHARNKVYLGYSDAGNLLGALYRADIGRPAHGPMPVDFRREGGEAAVLRSLSWLAEDDPEALEEHIVAGQKYAAFNLITLSMMVGTPIMPNLSGHVLMVEEISEYLYAFDRAMFNVTTHLKDAGLAGLRLGRVNGVPENDRPFGENEEDIARRWCERNDIAYLGRADIGHDVDNKIVPFGLFKG